MSSARLGRLALRAYPADVRDECGEEMLGTLLDAGDDSRRAFARGIRSLLVGGALERARDNARVGNRRLVADAFCLAGVLSSLLELRQMTELPFGPPVWTIVVLAGVPAFAVLGRDRMAGLCGLAVTVNALIVGFGVPAAQAGQGPLLLGHPGLVSFIDRWLGPAVCFTSLGGV